MLLLVGQDAYQFNGVYSYYYTIIKLDFDGTAIWTESLPRSAIGSSVANSIAVDRPKMLCHWIFIWNELQQ